MLLWLVGWLEHTKAKTPSPIIIIGWTVFLGYSLKSFWLAWAIPNNVYFHTHEYTSSHIYIGQAVVLTGALFIAIGYCSFLKLSFINIPLVLPRRAVLLSKSLYWLVLVSAAFAIIALYSAKGLHQQIMNAAFVAARFYVADNGVTTSLGFLLLGADIIVAYFIYYLSIGQPKVHFRIYWILILIVGLSYILSSQRMGVLIILIGSLLASPRRLVEFRSLRSWTRVGLIFAVMAALSITGYVRSEHREVSANELTITKGVEATLNHVFQGLYALDPAKLTGIALKHDEMLLGKSFGLVFVAPIPKLTWPEKPDVRIGRYVMQDVLEFNVAGGAPPSAFGEFYLNFRWPGIVFGSFLIGCFAGWVRSQSRYKDDRHTGLVRARTTLLSLLLVFFLIGDFTYAALFSLKYVASIVICESYWRHQLSRNRTHLGFKIRPNFAQEI